MFIRFIRTNYAQSFSNLENLLLKLINVIKTDTLSIMLYLTGCYY